MMKERREFDVREMIYSDSIFNLIQASMFSGSNGRQAANLENTGVLSELLGGELETQF